MTRIIISSGNHFQKACIDRKHFVEHGNVAAVLQEPQFSEADEEDAARARIRSSIPKTLPGSENAKATARNHNIDLSPIRERFHEAFDWRRKVAYMLDGIR
jgi:hypothetical protein